MVKSFYGDKNYRQVNVSAYWGNLLVAEGYYLNTKGNVEKVIFFPSNDFYDRTPAEKRARDSFSDSEKLEAGIADADVLFRREFPKKKSLKDVITVIPFNRAEKTLERQRAYGHELFNPVEMIMRADTSVLNVMGLMSVLFYRNRNEGNSPQNIQDLNVSQAGDVQDIGDREFIDQPLTHDLNAMIQVRNLLLQWALQKSFLSGLDNMEAQGSGRGADFAKYRLVRDGRIHKHDVEDFGKGEVELYSKVLRDVLLDLKKPEKIQDRYVRWLFVGEMLKQKGYDKEFFEFEDDEILEDTFLPYWITVAAIRNGASHMGAAEMVLYSELMQVFGDGLDQQQRNNMTYMGFRSQLGSQDAADILGDPRDRNTAASEQIYRATLENAAILGSVDQGVLNFSPVGILDGEDDPIAHLAQVHNPKCEEILKMLQDGELPAGEMATAPESTLETRIDLILKLAALTNHTSLHLEQLTLFGKARDDVNQLKEQTNAIIQSAEGLLNNLQITLRALQTQRAEKEAKLRGELPEDETRRLELQNDMMALQNERNRDNGKLAIANRIAEDNKKQHMDGQLSKARDRAQKQRQAERDAQQKDIQRMSDAQQQEIQRFTDASLKARDLVIKEKDIEAKKEIAKSKLNGQSKQ